MFEVGVLAPNSAASCCLRQSAKHKRLDASVSISIGWKYENHSFSSYSWRDPGADDLVAGCAANCSRLGATGCQSVGASRASSTDSDRASNRSIEPACASIRRDRDGFD